MPASITFHVDPSPRAIAKQMRFLGREFRSWRPAWRQALPWIVAGVRENFRSEGSTLGDPWEPLARATWRRKLAAGQGGGPLVGTGTNILNPISGGGVVQMTATRLRYGLTSSIANIQHHGTKDGRLPGRRFVAWSPVMEAATMRALEQYARYLLRKAASMMRGTYTEEGANPWQQTRRAPGPRARDRRGRFTKGPTP